MKKSRLKRIFLGLIQHLLAAAVTISVVGLLLNSYINVESIDGPKTYKIFPITSDLEFEDSEIYHDLFRNAVSDITQLVMIKDQMETNGVLDPMKKIDVTAFAKELGVETDCAVTAVYELDDIVKWGKSGVEYKTRIMSLSEFVNYFGYCIYPENFVLNEYGQLEFDGFHRVEDLPKVEEEQDGTLPENEQDPMHQVQTVMNTYSDEQLEDLVSSFIMAHDLPGVGISREDDGSLTVYLELLTCRYATISGEKQLVDMVNNWVDCIRLQSNVAETINTIAINYPRYQLCNSAYSAENSNVKYMVRLMTENGNCTYTNVPQLTELSDNDVTEFFQEYRRYLIYYPDNLVFMGNTVLSEDEIDAYISKYAYPDTTHIWLGVDTTYPIEGDMFRTANDIYEKIVPNVSKIIILIAGLAVIWVVSVIYLSITAGVAVTREGKKVYYTNRFDRIATELLICLMGIFSVGAVWGFYIVRDLVQGVGTETLQALGIHQLTRMYQYGICGIFGVYVSLTFGIVWYSLVRRIKAGNLWKDSFLHLICAGIVNTVKLVIRHKNSAVSTLIPYNLFLLTNLAGILVMYILRSSQAMVSLFILIILVVIDCAVGVALFRQRAEQIEIVEGISRIRDGEVEFKLETGSLHGANRELADAVNNIGEGIEKAVKSSMKDEQMKTDLITNVSHDIKTPLTSIINYVDLLKRLKIEEEPAKGYITILDGKAQKLKQLSDDLVEVSKISSGNIVLEKERLNLTELVNQSIGEFSEKMEENGLHIVFDDTLPTYIYADSRRMWRVVENLLNNVCKYALEGTRVYIDLVKEDGMIELSVKNISKQQMNVRGDDLTERFIRGDSSRTTEGSGLGLSIAKSLVQVHGGTFEIVLDGDLFKVVLTFPEYVESEMSTTEE